MGVKLSLHDDEPKSKPAEKKDAGEEVCGGVPVLCIRLGVTEEPDRKAYTRSFILGVIAGACGVLCAISTFNLIRMFLK